MEILDHCATLTLVDNDPTSKQGQAEPILPGGSPKTGWFTPKKPATYESDDPPATLLGYQRHRCR